MEAVNTSCDDAVSKIEAIARSTQTISVTSRLSGVIITQVVCIMKMDSIGKIIRQEAIN